MRINRLAMLAVVGVQFAAWGQDVANSWGNLSDGKFYKYNPQPDASYPDRWEFPVGTAVGVGRYSDGARLTDGVRGIEYPLTEWVGWLNQATATIDVDLGSVRAISDVGINAASRTAWGVFYPQQVCFFTSLDGSTWSSYGSCVAFASDTSSFSADESTHAAWASARFVRAVVHKKSSNSNYFMIDEFWVNGTTTHTRKHAPVDGGVLSPLNGAYPVAGTGSMQIALFEAKFDRNVDVALWYSDQNNQFDFAMAGVTPQLGNRKVELAFLPHCTTSEQVASGVLDSFLVTYFQQMRSYVDSRHDAGVSDFALWFRPMNEMNGGATHYGNPNTYNDAGVCSGLRYGGDALSYRWAYRRMFNILERLGNVGVGTANNDIMFLWSVESKEVAGDPLSQMENYYPGDPYVDWAGASVYGEGLDGGICNVGVDELLEKLDTQYGNRKPLMISEGGCESDGTAAGDTKRAKWIRDWFFVPEVLRPHYRAAVWFNKGGHALHPLAWQASPGGPLRYDLYDGGVTSQSIEAYRPTFR